MFEGDTQVVLRGQLMATFQQHMWSGGTAFGGGGGWRGDH